MSAFFIFVYIISQKVVFPATASRFVFVILIFFDLIEKSCGMNQVQAFVEDIQEAKIVWHYSGQTWLFLATFWLSFIGLVSLNCYFHSVLLEKVSHTFLQSFIWSAEFWWHWALLSPLALADAKGVFNTIVNLEQVKKYFVHACSFSLYGIALSSLALFAFTSESGASDLLLSVSKKFFNELYIGILIYGVIVTVGVVLLWSNQRKQGVTESKISSPVFSKQIVALKGQHKVIVAVDKILYIAASGNYLEIYTEHDSFLVRKTMKAFLSQLDPQEFVRIHRSTIVAIKSIDSITPRACGDFLVRLTNGVEVNISKSYRSIIKQLEQGANAFL